MEEVVVLVDEENNELGTAPKDTVHTSSTPLHRGFSLFLFNSNGQLLLTKRSSKKKTFPGVWTNTVCGHPGSGESAVEAASRRLKDELGLSLKRSHLFRLKGETFIRFIREVAPYRYRFVDAHGIVENEICPILVAHSDATPTPDPSEVEDWKWIGWKEFLGDIKKDPVIYSPWSIEEAIIIDQLEYYSSDTFIR